jgi:hypothetical protein
MRLSPLDPLNSEPGRFVDEEELATNTPPSSSTCFADSPPPASLVSESAALTPKLIEEKTCYVPTEAYRAQHLEEMQTLELIFMNEMEILATDPPSMKFHLNPNNSDNPLPIPGFVFLIVTLTSQYPDQPPRISIHHDMSVQRWSAHLDCDLLGHLSTFASTSVGMQMVFALIDAAKVSRAQPKLIFGIFCSLSCF